MSRMSIALAGIVLASSVSAGAWAFQAAPVDTNAPSSLILAAEGCGAGKHRDEHNRCVRDDHEHCARGWHWHDGHHRCER